MAVIPRVALPPVAAPPRPRDNSPNVNAFPFYEIVIKLILVLSPEYPPEKTPRTGEDNPPPPAVVLVISPKSSAFPRVCISKKSIT